MVHTASVLTVMLLVATGITAQTTVAWDDLRVTFSFTTNERGFFRLPRTLDEAVLESWSQPPETSNSPYDIRCPETDPSVCVVLNKVTGDINGIQISFLQSDTASPYDYKLHPMFVPGKRFDYDVYTVTMFTVKPAGATEAGSRQETGDGLWMEVGPKGVPFFEIPRQKIGMADTLFTLQNCVEKMGTHYYYNISTALACEDFEPMFALYKDDEMLGFGVQTWGTPTKLGSKDWFEPVPAAAIRPTVPDCPQCLVDWTSEHHLISMHVYFIDEPWNILCPAA